MTRRLAWGASLVALALASPAPAHAGLDALAGHMTLGYAKLFPTKGPAPGGSFSVTAGFDYPLTSDLRIGADIGYHLLGSRTETRGSLFANVDYSAFEATLLAHWMPGGPWPRVSFGPSLISARADLSTGGGGAAFSDLAVEEVAPGAALDVTIISKRPSPVRVGVELGTRWGFLSEATWTLATARLAIHY